MADRVVQRLSESSNKNSSIGTANPGVQMKCSTCEEDDLQKKEDEELSDSILSLQKKDVGTPSENTSNLENKLNSSKGSGSSLPSDLQTSMGSEFGADFSNVRVHTGSEAVQMSQDIGAQAFTHGSDIYFNEGKYDTNSNSGKHLLAHELTHTVQQGSTKPSVQRSVAEDLIDTHTSWGNLDEIALGRVVKNNMIQGNYALVNSIFDELDSMNTDDIAYEATRLSSDAELDTVASDQTGRRLLDRMYDLLTGGFLSQEEQTQSDRILDSKSRQLSLDVFPQELDGIKIFPFRLPGITVFSDAPITAERRSNGIIHIKMPVRVLGMDTYRNETRTLPDETFISGIEIPEEEVIGVKLYDMGGPVVFKPALYLIRLSNETTTQVISSMIEAAGLGLSLGAGEFVVLGAEASLAARAVLWADRAALVLGTLTTVINEHRGWIISTFGNAGKEFVYYNSLVNSAVAIYGLGRMVYGLGQLLNNFRQVYSNFRGVAGSIDDIDAPDQNALVQIQSNADDFFENADNLASTRRTDAPELDVETPNGVSAVESADSVPSRDVNTSSNIDQTAEASALTSADRVSGRIVAQVEEGVQIGGRRHGLSIKVTEDGRTIVQICTDCDGILHIIAEAMRDPAINDSVDLVRALRRIQDDAVEVQNALPEGRMTRDAADSILDDLAEQLEALSAGNEHPLTPHLDSVPNRLPRLSEEEALDIINGLDDMSSSQIDELLTRQADDPILRNLLAVRGTHIDSHFKAQIAPQIRSNMPQNSMFTSNDSTALKSALGIDDLPWNSGQGPDLILVDVDSHAIAILDLTSRANPRHAAQKRRQAEALLQILGEGWRLDSVRDFYHGYRNMTLERTIQQIGEILRRFNFSG